MKFQMECELTSDYDVSIVDRIFDAGSPYLANSLTSRRSVIITTPTVEKIYGSALRAYVAERNLDAAIETLALDERRKTIESVLRICETAKQRDLGRRDFMVAFGGGICCDVVTLAASLVRRGIGYVCVPTTLIGQVDAGVGLKGGVNFGDGKNYLGCFAPPAAVLVDPAFLRTLPARALRCGVAEILKMALIRDADLFVLLERYGSELIDTGFGRPEAIGRRIIARSIELMLDELRPNCYEKHSLMRLVDFGHTFSPILEAGSNYALAHGEAVAIDMAVSCAIAAEMGLMGAEDCTRTLDLIQALGLPIYSPLCSLDLLEAAFRAAGRHRGGPINFVVPTRIGTGSFVRERQELPPRAQDAALERLAALAATSVPPHQHRGEPRRHYGEDRRPGRLQPLPDSGQWKGMNDSP